MDDPTALGVTIPAAHQMGFRLRPHPWWPCTYDFHFIFRILDSLPRLVHYDLIFTYSFPLLDIIFILAIPLSSYEAYKRKTGMALIAMQPNVPDDAYMSYMKGMYVPFNMAYGSLIYH